MTDTYYPLPAFAFSVAIKNGSQDTSPSVSDSSFQEVTGISSEMETEPVEEGGGGYAYHLPKLVKYEPLTLKRGTAATTSDLVAWCSATMQNGSGLASPINTKTIVVSLLIATAKYRGESVHDPSKGEIGPDVQSFPSWSFYNAYPVKWEVESFNSTKNEVAIEKIVLKYDYFTFTAGS